MTDLIGQTIGQYKIEALIGSGGMGAVYRGTHVYLNRAAAVKVLHPNIASDASVQARFQLEAKAAAALKNPNVIEIYDFGKQADLYFLVMELMTAGSLRGLLSESIKAGGLLPVQQTLNLLRQAADGLAYAHGEGMIHRDIKPDNLLLNAQAGGFIVKIADFGLARLNEGSVLTPTGTTMGTPAYMSPEQCQGAALDGRSDIYALGVVLYEAVTGYLPFNAKTVSEAVYKHMHVAPEPPRKLKPDLTADIEAIILRCIAKKPAERYASALELSTALQAAVASKRWMSMSTLRMAPQQVSNLSSEALGETVLREMSGQTPPPSSLGSTAGANSGASGAPDTPRVRVQDQTGAVVQAVPLGSQGLTVGRAAGNTIQLASDDISRQHLRVDWDGSVVRVTDLNSANGSYLDDQRLAANVAQVWDGRQPLRVGNYWLRLKLPGRGATGDGGPVGAAQARESRVSVTPDSDELLLTPGQAQKWRVSVMNGGTQVEHFAITIEGEAAGWVPGEYQVELNPNTSQGVDVMVNVPRTSASRAGKYNVTVRARSLENPTVSGAAVARWTVLPFGGTSLSVTPMRASAWRRAVFTLALRNEGNIPADIDLNAADEERKLGYEFINQGRIWQSADQSQTLRLEAGNAATIRLNVRAPLQWIGQARTMPVLVQVSAKGQAAQGDPTPLAQQQVSVQFSQRALIPTWVLPALLALLIASCVLLYAFFQQQAETSVFAIATPGVQLGKPALFKFKVGNAQRVEIRKNGQPVAADSVVFDPATGEGTYTMQSAEIAELTLLAYNRLGQPSQPRTLMFNPLQPTATSTITPTPTPVPGDVTLDALHVFVNGSEVPLVNRQLIVRPGDRIRVEWKLSNATSVSARGTTKDATDSDEFVALESKPFILSAQNAAGRQFSLQLDVVAVAPTTTPAPTLTPAPTATPSVPQATCCARSNSVSVLSGPDASFAEIGKLISGNIVPVLARSTDGRWWKVAYNGGEGWIKVADVSFGGNVNMPVESTVPKFNAEFGGGSMEYAMQPSGEQLTCAQLASFWSDLRSGSLYYIYNSDMSATLTREDYLLYNPMTPESTWGVKVSDVKVACPNLNPMAKVELTPTP